MVYYVEVLFYIKQQICILNCVSVPDNSNKEFGGQGGRVVTLSPPTSEARVRFPALRQGGKLVVACHWSAVYSTEP